MASGKTLIVKLDILDDKHKRKAMKIVSSITGIQSVTADAAGQKLTVACGSADPVCVVTKLRKRWVTVEVISIADPPKKEEKEKKGDEKDEKKEDNMMKAAAAAYAYYNPYPYRPLYMYPVEEQPNSCVIC